MASKKASKLWIVNVVSFMLFIILSVTGLLNGYVLPRGYETRGSFLVSVRHFFVALHEWTALIFMVLVVIHIALHWSYVKSNLKKYSNTK